jgi:hypothetical protein
MSQNCLNYYNSSGNGQYVGPFTVNGSCSVGYLGSCSETTNDKCSDINDSCGMTLQQGCQYVDSQDGACTTACAENFTQRRENYTPCCRPQPYVPVSQTWGIQKPYTL